MPDELPRFIAPMLAKLGEPFDSDDYLFEIKWDGTRALAFVEHDAYRILNRREIELNERYPEFECLQGLEPGTVLDGEIVVLQDGKPDFDLLLSREQLRSPFKIKTASRSLPATFMAFDQLYRGFDSLLRESLADRREELRRTVAGFESDKVVFSDGVIGNGRSFFEGVCQQGLEGVMAKRLRSPYSPGKRSDAWLKIKRRLQLYCAVVGFVPAEPAGTRDFRSLIIAIEEDGELRPVGKVGSGVDEALRHRLNDLLWSRIRQRPIVACRVRGKWVEPGLYCTVSYAERTKNGELRAPVLEDLIVE